MVTAPPARRQEGKEHITPTTITATITIILTTTTITITAIIITITIITPTLPLQGEPPTSLYLQLAFP